MFLFLMFTVNDVFKVQKFIPLKPFERARGSVSWSVDFGTSQVQSLEEGGGYPIFRTSIIYPVLYEFSFIFCVEFLYGG